MTLCNNSLYNTQSKKDSPDPYLYMIYGVKTVKVSVEYTTLAQTTELRNFNRPGKTIQNNSFVGKFPELY